MKLDCYLSTQKYNNCLIIKTASNHMRKKCSTSGKVGGELQHNTMTTENRATLGLLWPQTQTRDRLIALGIKACTMIHPFSDSKNSE